MNAIAKQDEGMTLVKPCDVSPKDARAKVFAMEPFIKELPKVDMPLRHFFADGVYVREIFMPANTLVTGHIHKHEHVAMMISGSITIFDHTGTWRMEGYNVFTSQPGAKRALVIHEDTIFVTIHRLRDPDMRDMDDLDKEFVAETSEEFEAFKQIEVIK